ncbi:hypothetical protein OVY48_06335 [Sphingobium sp. SA2]|uniref:hypothetical protein n=1 Tax=Sphingobium sp. SA2 TaxID=1524832 RepID=UPI0028C0AF13|nr:hypothetical protein [Sphingobium sp. SA2]MDT7533054.1 hypothetical protein [Sphingobium sp. SA2]
MARTLEQERAAIEEDARRLEERRQKLADKEREQMIQAVEKSGLLKLAPKRLDELVGKIRKLGIEEVEKRLAA